MFLKLFYLVIVCVSNRFGSNTSFVFHFVLLSVKNLAARSGLNQTRLIKNSIRLYEILASSKI